LEGLIEPGTCSCVTGAFVDEHGVCICGQNFDETIAGNCFEKSGLFGIGKVRTWTLLTNENTWN
jgi:hypothetical protein